EGRPRQGQVQEPGGRLRRHEHEDGIDEVIGRPREEARLEPSQEAEAVGKPGCDAHFGGHSSRDRARGRGGGARGPTCAVWRGGRGGQVGRGGGEGGAAPRGGGGGWEGGEGRRGVAPTSPNAPRRRVRSSQEDYSSPASFSTQVTRSRLSHMLVCWRAPKIGA